MEKRDILKKYSEEDKILISNVIDKIQKTRTCNYITSTDFLNLHEQTIIKKLLLEEKIENYFFFGLDFNLERKVLIFFPDKINKEIAMDKIKNIVKIVRITLPKYSKESYSHREYLGGLMKLGLKREKIGDIIVSKNGADIVIKKEITKYIDANLQALTRFQKSNIEVLDFDELSENTESFEQINIIVPSLRIDNIVSDILHISRSKTIQVIDSERVFLNFEICKNHSKIVNEEDIISIRGKGRFKIIEILGNTRKGNIIIKIYKYI